ncbi:MAG: molecular chaperone TorD family protein [Motiliproteus sp.]
MSVLEQTSVDSQTVDPQVIDPKTIDSKTIETQPIERSGSLNPLQQFRSDSYALLGSLLSQSPSQPLLQWLTQVELVDDQQSAMREAWEVLQLAASRAQVEQVSNEYHSLFIGVGRGELLPFASWYMTGFLMEKPLVTLRQDLQQLGFERDPDVREPEDHIAALCQVMAMIGSDDGVDRAVQQQFFERHLASWWQRFFNDLQTSQTSHFYSAVGRFAELFFEQESLLLQTP